MRVCDDGQGTGIASEHTDKMPLGAGKQKTGPLGRAGPGGTGKPPDGRPAPPRPS